MGSVYHQTWIMVSITVISFGYDAGYADMVDFQNDEDLIDKMLDKL